MVVLLATLLLLTLTTWRSSAAHSQGVQYLRAEEPTRILIKQPTSVSRDSLTMKGTPQDGDEMVDVQTELKSNGDIKLKFSSHGKTHSLELAESRIKLADIAVKLVGSSEEYTRQVLEEVKDIKMMRDEKSGAMIAFKTHPGEVKPLIRRGLFKLGRHQFDMNHDTLSNRTKVTRKTADDKFAPQHIENLIPKDKIRKKRDIPADVSSIYAVIELAIIIDYKIWSERVTGDVVAAGQADHTVDVLLYYAHMTAIMDDFYGSMDNIELKINIVLAGIVIITSPLELPNLVEEYDVYGKLGSFATIKRLSDWLETAEAEDTLPLHDHVMLFTGYDLYSEDTGSANTISTQYTGYICSAAYSSSLIQSRGLLTYDARTAASALGGSLGADHDGTGGSSACPDQNYIMGSRADNDEFIDNRFLFSCCSQRSFYATIKENGECLMISETNPTYMASVEENVRNFLPGEVFTADDQCYLQEGTSECGEWVYEKRNTNLCSELWCITRDVPNTCTATLKTPAADGTECGASKVCSRGYCVEKWKYSVNVNAQNCNVAECYWNEKMCDYGVNTVLPQMFRCYHDSVACDGTSDCSDGSDEICDENPLATNGTCYFCIDTDICVNSERDCELHCSHDPDCNKRVTVSDSSKVTYHLPVIVILMIVCISRLVH